MSRRADRAFPRDVPVVNALPARATPPSADALVDSYRHLARTHPHLTSEALRRLAATVPTQARVTLTAQDAPFKAPVASRGKAADPTALPAFLAMHMRQSLKAGATAEALEYARRLRTHLGTPASDNDKAVEVASLLLETGTVEAVCNRNLNALADFSRALRLSASSPELRATIALPAAVVNAAFGRLNEATRLLGVATDAPVPPARPAPLALLATALIAVERLDADAGVILDQMADDELASFWPFAVLARVRWETVQGAYGAALNVVAIAEAGHNVASGTISESILAYCRSLALACLGHPRAAFEVIRTVTPKTPDLQLLHARLALQLGDDETADALLNAILRDETTGPIVMAEGALMKLWVANRGGAEKTLWLAMLATRSVASESLQRPLTTVPVRIASMASPTRVALIDIPEPIVATRLRGSHLTVLHELSRGGTLDDIARRLQLSVHTVRTHTKALYKSLGVHSREEAVELARRTGLLH